MSEKPLAIFALSTGRCGTMTLALLLDLSPEIKCFHEPTPRLVIESKKAYDGSACAGEVFLACRIDLVTEVLDRRMIYGECANRSTFFAPHIDTFFNRRVKFIHLVRNLEEFVQSGINRQYYAGNPWDIGRIVPKEGWNGQSQTEKLQWLWNETNAYIMRFLATVDENRKFRLDFPDLVSGNMDSIRKIFSFIGVDAPAEEKVRYILKHKLNASITAPGGLKA